MITKPTVLVLGAGASKPYGYPLGGELLEILFRHLGNNKWTRILGQCGVEYETIKEFRGELNLSQQPSVDSFLEYRPEFSNVGKLSIALSLMTCEQAGKLIELPRNSKGFYHHLFIQLNTSWEEIVNNKLTIVTFNYDRSLEYYLFEALKHTHNKPDDLVTETLSNIPIIHVHGSLGPLPWQETGGRPYTIIDLEAPVQSANQIEAASKNLLIVSEEEKSTIEFNRAFECLKSAEKIYFLGFGYHTTNLKKLKLQELSYSDNEATVDDLGNRHTVKYLPYRGSALGRRTAQRRTVSRNWGIRLPDSELNDLEFLKEYAELD